MYIKREIGTITKDGEVKSDLVVSGMLFCDFLTYLYHIDDIKQANNMLEKESAFKIGKNLVDGGVDDIDMSNVKDLGTLFHSLK